MRKTLPVYDTSLSSVVAHRKAVMLGRRNRNHLPLAMVPRTSSRVSWLVAPRKVALALLHRRRSSKASLVCQAICRLKDLQA